MRRGEEGRGARKLMNTAVFLLWTHTHIHTQIRSKLLRRSHWPLLVHRGSVLLLSSQNSLFVIDSKRENKEEMIVQLSPAGVFLGPGVSLLSSFSC